VNIEVFPMYNCF